MKCVFLQSDVCLKFSAFGLCGLHITEGNCNNWCHPLTVQNLSRQKEIEDQQNRAIIKKINYLSRVHYPRINAQDPILAKEIIEFDHTPRLLEKYQSAHYELPPLLARLTALGDWIRTIAIPFHKATGLYFAPREQKEKRIAVCNGCDKFVTEENGEYKACAACGCRLGHIHDTEDADPNEQMRLLAAMGDKGKVAEAVRIKNAAWYQAKKCPHPDGDQWRQVDEQYMTAEQLAERDRLYER